MAISKDSLPLFKKQEGRYTADVVNVDPATNSVTLTLVPDTADESIAAVLKFGIPIAATFDVDLSTYKMAAGDTLILQPSEESDNVSITVISAPVKATKGSGGTCMSLIERY